jgi:hypothetical protein
MASSLLVLEIASPVTIRSLDVEWPYTITRSFANATPVGVSVPEPPMYVE